MRFGIMAMQIGALLPPGALPDQLVSHLLHLDQAEVVTRLVAKGFDPIELNGDLGSFLPHTLSPQSLEKLCAIDQVSYTVHLPLWSVEPSTPVVSVRRGSVEAIVDCIQRMRSLEPEMYVIHATGALASEFYAMDLPDLAKAFLMRQFQGNARESIQAILAQTGLSSRQLVVETVGFPFDLTLELAEEFDLSICLDTGHVLVGFCGPIDLFDALEACLPRLGEVHLHDGPWQGPERTIGYGKDHQALGRGDLDVGRFLDRLAEENFSGPVVFELTEEEAVESLEVIGSIRPDMVQGTSSIDGEG